MFGFCSLSLWIALHRSQGCGVGHYSVMLHLGLGLRSKGSILSVGTQDGKNLLQKSPKTFLLLCLLLGKFDIYCHICGLGSVSLLWVAGLSSREGHGSHAHFFCWIWWALIETLFCFVYILSSLSPSFSFWGFSASRISAEGSPRLPRAGAFPFSFLSWSKPETGLQGGKDHQSA